MIYTFRVDSTLESPQSTLQTRIKARSSCQNANVKTPSVLSITKRGSNFIDVQLLNIDPNFEFKNTIQILNQIVATQTIIYSHLIPVLSSPLSSMTFLEINPPKYIISKLGPHP